MIDYARPHDQNMCEFYLAPAPPAQARLDDFQVFKKSNAYIYGNYYSNAYDTYQEPELDTTVYHTLVNSREYHRDDWKYKVIAEWNEDDTVSWLIDTAQCIGFSEYDVPFYNFKVNGSELKAMKREEMQHRMSTQTVDPLLSRRFADEVFEKLQSRLSAEVYRDRESSVFRYLESDPYQHTDTVQTVLDLDSLDHKNRLYASDYRPNDSRLLQGACDSSDDAEDVFRSSETASPVFYGSDVSKSGDEDDKRKTFKRPPGRPKGSGRKVCKRPRSVSVPEFLRNLLLDPRHNPAIIKWEDYSQKKFRFVKPDEVAKLWGQMKQNDNMTFEKFSRAMRYHYRQGVLVSVPTARLVYQFGPKGPDITCASSCASTAVKVKSETEASEIVYS